VLRRPSPLLRQLRALSADRLVFSLSGAFDLAEDPSVCRFLCHSKVPYVLVVQHNLDDPIPAARRAPARDVFRAAALNCFVSAANLLAVERQTAASVPNAMIINNPINLPDYKPIPWPAAEIPRLACVARLDARFKGQDVLLQVLASERWRRRPWRLSLYGAGADEPYLRALAEHFQIVDRVRFCGHHPDVGKVWADEQVLVLPSRSEGTPLALIEAVIAGRPVVVTDAGDNARWVEPGVTGFVADGCTLTAVDNALESAWARRAEWPEMGKAARRIFHPRLDLHPAQTLLDAVLAVGARR
jgi:L-malate glycosyltransferase